MPAINDTMIFFSMTPLDKGESVSEYVARSLNIIDESGLDYRLTPMGTIIEGTWDNCFAVIHNCYEQMRQDCHRISVSIKVDYRKDQEGRLTRKIKSVEEKVGKSLKK